MCMFIKKNSLRKTLLYMCVALKGRQWMNLYKPDEETFLSRMERNTKILIVIQEFYLYRMNIYGAILA